MRLGYFTMPVHPMHRNWAETLQEDREAIILADKLGFYDAFVGEHLTDKCENITNSMMFLATLIPDDQDHQARHRHHQPLAHASGGDRPAGGDVRPSVRRPLHLRRQPRRADLRRRGARHPGAGPQQDVRRVDRRDPGDLGARAALRHRLPRQPLQGLDRAHQRSAARHRLHGQAVPEAAAGDRRHGGGAVLAGVVHMGKRDFHPLSANFLLSKHLKSHWQNYCKGKAEAGVEPKVSDWRVARTIFVADDDKTAARYGRDDANSPYRFYWRRCVPR